jgi:hypothetical protein
MLTLEIHHAGGLYAQRLVEYFRGRGGEVEAQELPRDLPMIIDEPEEYLPKEAGHADVVIAVHMHQDLLVELPDLMAAHGGKALIVPLEDPDWARPGLVRQVSELCRARNIECEFPKPFCALTPQGPVLTQFSEEYGVGKPELVLTQGDGCVVRAECRRGAPCGLTVYAANKLVGTNLSQETLARVHSLHATHPCLATMNMDPALGDTVMHLSVGMLYEAVQEAVKKAKDAE